MKVFYNGTDIYEKVSVNYAVYETFAEKQADILTVRFNDPKGNWSKWNPQTGDTIAIEFDSIKTGEMFVCSIKPENGLITIRAMAMPLSIHSKATKSWEKIGFLALCQEIAGKHGLGFENYDVSDQTYDYMAQDDEEDIAFLNKLCTLEGCQMLFYDKKLIVYDEKSMESKDAVGELELDIAGVFTYEDNTKLNYGKCEVISGLCSGSATDGNGNADKVLRPQKPLFVNSDSEANRFAAGLLKNANKNGKTGVFARELKTDYAAASVVNIKTAKAEGWNGKVFLTAVRHDFVKNKTTFHFRAL